MLKVTLHLKVHYATNSRVNACDLLQAYSTKSKGICAAKIESARVPATSEIGKWGKKFIQEMSKSAVKKHPNLSNITTPTMKRIGVKDAKKYFNNNSNEAEPWGVCQVLNS